MVCFFIGDKVRVVDKGSHVNGFIGKVLKRRDVKVSKFRMAEECLVSLHNEELNENKREVWIRSASLEKIPPTFDLTAMSYSEALFIVDTMLAGLDSCFVENQADCEACQLRVSIIRPLMEQGIRSGHDYREIKKKWGINDQSHEYQRWLASQTDSTNSVD